MDQTTLTGRGGLAVNLSAIAVKKASDGYKKGTAAKQFILQQLLESPTVQRMLQKGAPASIGCGFGPGVAAGAAAAPRASALPDG